MANIVNTFSRILLVTIFEELNEIYEQENRVKPGLKLFDNYDYAVYIKLHRLFDKNLFVLPACVYVYSVHVWSTLRPGEGGGFLGIGVTDGNDLLCGYRE